MKNLLLVGENPFSTTGNAKMMRYVIKQVDTKKYCFHVFSIDSCGTDPLAILARPIPFPMISSLVCSSKGYEEPKGTRLLLEILSRKSIDIVLFVGVDIWQYSAIYEHLAGIRKKTGMIWGGLFPYDQQEIREDWVKWFNTADFPCVYSEFGYDLLKEHVPNLRYFRPDVQKPHGFTKVSPEKKQVTRAKYFPTVKKDTIIFGFFGSNQFRKDPQKLIQAFGKLKQDPELRGKDIRLYMHTDKAETGVYNLTQTAIDAGLTGKGDLMIKQPGDWFTDAQIASILSGIDCLLNCSMQEGLSWTVIEAMYCGQPVICSYSTSHIELLEGTDNIGVPCLQESSLPSVTESGKSFIPTMSCAVDDIYDAMKEFILDPDLRIRMGESGRKKIAEWSRRASNINNLFGIVESELEEARLEKETRKKDAMGKMVFAQHASAGDILMTTKCLKGLKERHPDLKLVYMTQKKFHDILIGNPYIDELVDWDLTGLKGRYNVVYNPHGDRVLPGHWGRNCNTLLSDFYWKLVGVENGGFFIEKIDPRIGKNKVQWETFLSASAGGRRVCFVHTTGGDPHMRTYRFMDEVCKRLKDKYLTVQIGGPKDYPAEAECDLRGLTYRETAYACDFADIAVTVDSMMAHLCGAMGVSQVTLFGCANGFVVRPDQVSGHLICLYPDYLLDCKGLGPCSGQVRDCPTPCIGVVSPQDILDAVSGLEEKVGWNENNILGEEHKTCTSMIRK